MKRGPRNETNRATIVTLPLVEELAPAPDPWNVFRPFARDPFPLFLDSAVVHPTLGRYSFVTADPFATLLSRGNQVWWRGKDVSATDPWRVLAEQLRRWRAEPIPGVPPFQGGAAGLLGYDLCHHLERLPRPARDEYAVPDLALGFYDWVLGFDHVAGRAWLLSTGFPETEPERRHRRALRRLRAVRRRLESPLPGSEKASFSTGVSPVDPGPRFPVPGMPGVFSNFTPDSYRAAVRRAIDYVHAGDCFQVNLSQRLLTAPATTPLVLYERLRARNAAPFSGYFDLGDFVLASASPERFLRVEDSLVQTRPIKGTRPCGSTPEEDRRRSDELKGSAKDRAENIMIVDLLRNDLGRVCVYGSVEVAALCRLETYRYVHHLVSEVRGRLRPECGLVDLLRASFPGGSVTGAPKVRAMEIIAELEPTARGAYCGSLGYLGFDGSMDSNILIRTFTLGRGWAQFPVGGGVVADSSPDEEYAETLHKVRGLVRALEAS